MTYHVDIDTVRRAEAAVRPRVKRTRLVRSAWLSSLHGGEVLLKCEHEQVTGSFKVRGAVAKVAAAKPDRVAAASAGNHGLGLAWAAREAGIPCTIFVPRTLPRVKEEKIVALGARLIKAPFDTYDPTQEYAKTRLDGALWVSAYDDPDVIAGNGGTTANEIIEDAQGPVDVIVVPCGGGGLAIGAGVVAWNITKIVGVNSEASPGMWLSRRDGHAHLSVDSKPTIAEGIEGGVSETTYALGREFIDDIVLVSEEAIGRAVAEMKRREGMTIEGSAAAAVAAVVEGRISRKGRVVVVLTGGNIDPDRLEALLRKHA